MSVKNIIAGSAGFDSSETELGSIILYALELSKNVRPSICYVPTASGDSPELISHFYDACSQENVSASHLQLFPMPNHEDIASHILKQDVIWVGGGSVVNLLAVWKEHGLYDIFRTAWENGVVLGGFSAGSICWSAGGTTDSYGLKLRPIINNQALLPFSSGVHYDSEMQRRPLFRKLIGEEILPEGYATDDGVSIHFVDTEIHKVISDNEGKYAYHVYKDKDGRVVEDKIKPELLS